MRDIRVATCSRCVRSVGGNKATKTWPFSMEFVPKGETDVCEWRGRERKSAPSTDGGEVTQPAPERHSFCSWLEDLAVGQFCGESYQQSHSMYVLRGDARVNKLFANTECFIL
jgi:hypothetical protein